MIAADILINIPFASEDRQLMNTKFECHHCGVKSNGLMDIGQGQLCLDCYSKYAQAQYMSSQARSSELSGLLAAQAWAGEMIQFQLGFRSAPPQIRSHFKNTIMNQNLNLSNNTIGIVNTGEIKAETIKPTIIVNNSDFVELERNLNKLLAEVQISKELHDNDKNNITESASLIKEELNKPALQRRTTVVKNMMGVIENLAKGVRNIEAIWNTCQPLIVLALTKLHTYSA